jgi:glutamyl-Q tRNA(Asp) synthetase
LYVGRFAPSPTGPLHFGSLTTALASFLDARRHGGRWLLRIEDLDPPREQPGSVDQILSTLDGLGLHWDGDVLFQSQRQEAYLAALETLQRAGQLYTCTCSRREIIMRFQALGLTGPMRYPGTCRQRGPLPGRTTALRLAVGESERVRFHDRLQGQRCHAMADEFGDFVLRRRDGLYAYQLAVVVDDAYQQVTHIVRGTDLLDETPKQILLQRDLGYRTPCYAHVPIATLASGQKLSKQSGARAIDASDAAATLLALLEFLRQQPPQHLAQNAPGEILHWAVANWRPERLADTLGIAVGDPE